MPFPRRTCLIFAALCATSALSPSVLLAEDFECVMDAAETVELSPRTPGVIDSVEVSKGQHVAKGDVIARIASAMETAALKVLEARASSTAVIDAQTARLAFAQAQLKRAETLERKNAQSTAKVEELQNDLALANSQLQQAQVDRLALLAEVERARIAVENTLIRATVPGVVTEVVLSPGEYANAERPVAVLAQTDPIHVDAYLPATLFNDVHAGTKVRIRPEFADEAVITAPILSVDGILDPASRTFGIRIALPNPENTIVAGQRCRLELAAP